jgi:hypothetical protein
MLQAGFDSRCHWIFQLTYISRRTMVLGSTKPVTEMSTRNLPWGKGRPAREADNSPPSGSLDISQPYGPSWPVTGIALPFYLYKIEMVQYDTVTCMCDYRRVWIGE